MGMNVRKVPYGWQKALLWQSRLNTLKEIGLVLLVLMSLGAAVGLIAERMWFL